MELRLRLKEQGQCRPPVFMRETCCRADGWARRLLPAVTLDQRRGVEGRRRDERRPNARSQQGYRRTLRAGASPPGRVQNRRHDAAVARCLRDSDCWSCQDASHQQARSQSYAPLLRHCSSWEMIGANCAVREHFRPNSRAHSRLRCFTPTCSPTCSRSRITARTT